jgi:hypothetical protein
MSIIGKGFRATGKVIKWTLLACVALIVVAVVAAIFGLGSAANKSDKSSAKVTPAKYAKVHEGMRKAELRTLLGKEESADSQSISGTTMDCLYYGILSSKGSYQFCFENGKLFSKSRY